MQTKSENTLTRRTTPSPSVLLASYIGEAVVVRRWVARTQRSPETLLDRPRLQAQGD